MKKTIFLLWLLTPILSFCQDNSQPTMIENMGIVSELMSIKMNAEVAVSMAVSDTIGLISKKDKLEITEEYNKLRILSIPIIAQLISDISQKNSLKVFNKLDALLAQKKISDINTSDIDNLKIRAYIENLKALHTKLIEFYSKAYNLTHVQRGNPRFPAVGDVVGIFTAIETAVKDFNEARGKKVDKLVVILDATKIADLTELTNGDGGKADKKKTDK